MNKTVYNWRSIEDYLRQECGLYWCDYDLVINYGRSVIDLTLSAQHAFCNYKNQSQFRNVYIPFSYSNFYLSVTLD